MLKVASILTALAAILASTDADAVPVQIESTGATTNNSRTLEEIHLKQRRHVLFNSRQLTGQCLDLCPTRKPTQSPTTDPTENPTANPTNDPTESPTNDPTESPTDDPTESPTDDPTADPTANPTANPTCKEKKAIDVCLVLDNSGSICSIDKPRLCTDCSGGKNCKAGGVTEDSSCCVNNKKLEEFAINYIQSLDGEGTFSVVQYATEASTIAEQGDSNAAITAINDSQYTGGYTNTEAAIFECIQQLDNVDNPVSPVIILITDGVPTACRPKSADKESVICNNDAKCSECKNNSAKNGAVKMANAAKNRGMSLVPVVIQTVNTGDQWLKDKEWLSNLARCPNDDDKCDVGEYKDLKVDNVDDVGNILGSLIRMTECA